MSKKNSFKERLNALLDRFDQDGGDSVEFKAEGKLDDGTAIYTDADAWGEGVAVYTRGDNGEAQPLGNGTYTLSDGTEIVVSDGKIESMKPASGGDDDEMSKEDVLKLIESATEKLRTKFSKQIEDEKAEFSKQIEAKDKEIEDLKVELSKAKKLPRGGNHAHTDVDPEKERVELSKLNTADFIAALYEKTLKDE